MQYFFSIAWDFNPQNQEEYLKNILEQPKIKYKNI